MDVLAHISEGATDPAPVEVQENKCADGSPSACPLVVEDGNRKTSTGYEPNTLSQIADVTAENPIQAKSTDDLAFAVLALEAGSREEFALALETGDGLTIYDSNKNKITLRLNDFLDANIKNAFIKVWNLIGNNLLFVDGGSINETRQDSEESAAPIGWGP